jgi:hypothetical protein
VPRANFRKKKKVKVQLTNDSKFNGSKPTDAMGTMSKIAKKLSPLNIRA